MVTGLDDPELAKVALEHGAYGYVIKPFTPNEMLISVANALRRRELEIENRGHREALEGIVRARTGELEASAKRAQADPGGNGSAAVSGNRVPRPGDRWSHRSHEQVCSPPREPPRTRCRVDPAGEPDARRRQGGPLGQHPAEARKLDAGRADGDGAPCRDRPRDPRGIWQRAAGAGRHDRVDPPREVRRNRLPERSVGRARSRSKVRLRRSPTSSTLSPAIVRTGLRSRSTRRCR